MRYNEQYDSGSGRSRAKGSPSRSGQSARQGAGASRSGSSRGAASRSTADRSTGTRSAGSSSSRSAGGSSSRSTGSRSAGGSGSRSTGSTGSSYRSGGSRTGTRSAGTGRSGYSYRGGRRSGGRRRNSGRRGGSGFATLAIGGIVLILAITCIVFLMKGMKKEETGAGQPEITTVAETELQKNVKVDGIDITGMSRDEAKKAILKDFPWAMKVTWEEKTADVPDLMAGKVDALLDEIYSGEAKESYSLDTTGLDEAAKEAAAAVAAQWDKKAKNGSISSYDAAADKFIFSGAETGVAVDQEKLATDILAAVNDKKFDAVLTASVAVVEPEYSEAAARERYEKIGSFTTKTTANSKRNTNVKLSAQALNGTVIQPGQEFSFNETVGQRTAEKGYQGAAAYNNGEVVEEIGGGVCQTSSTLYNAVVKAGLKTTVRRSHTYEPSYVTPGTDATVSWGGPDYKFVNNTSAGIGIRAHYADQTVTVSIYGIPVLEEGETRSLKSTKIKDMDLPTPTYEEDPTLEPGVEKVKSKGSQGSRWETRLVIKKNGEVVSEEVDHHVTYKGHTPVILRNTSGTVAETQPGETPAEGVIDPSQSAPAPEGAGDGLHQGGAESSGAETEKPGGGSPKPGDGSSAEATKPGGTSAPTTAAPGPGDGEAPTTAAPKPDRTEAPGTNTQKPGGSDTSAPTQNPGSAPGGEAPTGGSPAPGGAPGNGGEIQTIAPNPGA
ncbi:MAG: VanW family protein [Eubacteriales bacterium]|nr:VanW family protein [Eubacteriales bacterium]